MNTLKGCTALITGASSGFGAEFARQLAPHATCIILVARRLERLEALAASIARPGLTVHCLDADLGDEAGTESFLQRLQQTGATISLLINNAGLGDHGLFETSEWARVKPMLDVNIRALTRLTHALLPGLVQRGRGAILNVSSIASLLPIPNMAVYAATKAYVTSFSEAIRAELRGSGVRVVALCPGPVDTEFFDRAERGASEKMQTPDFFKVTAEEVVRTGLRAVVRDEARAIPGLLVAVTMILVSLIPIFLLRPFLSLRGRSAE